MQLQLRRPLAAAPATSVLSGPARPVEVPTTDRFRASLAERSRNVKPRSGKLEVYRTSRRDTASYRLGKHALLRGGESAPRWLARPARLARPGQAALSAPTPCQDANLCLRGQLTFVSDNVGNNTCRSCVTRHCGWSFKRLAHPCEPFRARGNPPEHNCGSPRSFRAVIRVLEHRMQLNCGHEA